MSEGEVEVVVEAKTETEYVGQADTVGGVDSLFVAVSNPLPVDDTLVV